VSTVSTHVLDTALGRPAAGVPVTLLDAEGTVLAEAVTDDDGRVRPLGDPVAPGTYRVRFDLAGRDGFFPEVVIAFAVPDDEPDGHFHVPLLLSPFGYSTYRGS
jgi:5-hydroxyisourate hydrolase